MRTIHSLDEMTETARGWLAGGPVGFIPTSGQLHAGHLSLVQAAQRECAVTVVSILPDLHQGTIVSRDSGQSHDFTKDVQLLESVHVDVAFLPRPADIYPPTFATYVVASGPIVARLEGTHSPDQFRSVTTTFTRLFQLIRPDIAYFGQKSAQQVALVQRLVHDLCIDVSLHVLPTVREVDGLAVSSSNALLSGDERQATRLLYRALLAAKALIEQGERQVAFLEQTMAGIVASSPLLRLDHAVLCDPSTFEPIDLLPAPTSAQASLGLLLAVAAHVGSIRLTDNIQRTRTGYWLT